MDKKTYNSFDEIDIQLEIFKTEAQLEKAKLTHQYQIAREQLGLFSILGSAVSFVAKRAFLIKVLRKFIK